MLASMFNILLVIRKVFKYTVHISYVTLTPCEYDYDE